MKKLTGICLLAIASFTLQAQDKSAVDAEIETLTNYIRNITNSQLAEAEQNNQIGLLLTDFMSNNPVAVYKMRKIDMDQKLASAKDETPMSEDQVIAYIELQKQAYALIGELSTGNIPRGGSELVENETEAITTYCEWTISTGNEFTLVPGYNILTPEGISAYNNDAMMLNQDLGPNEKIPLIPMNYAWSYSKWKSVSISSAGF